jgi:tellurite resistance-related uncharacterized protein
MSIFHEIDDSPNMQKFWHPVATPVLNEPELVSGLLSTPSSKTGLIVRLFVLTGTSMYRYSVNLT